MLFLPAVDIKGGNFVRLDQGDPDKETIFGTDPVAAASQWQRAGARMLHIVDLDGAFSGLPRNMEAIIKISSLIPVEVGGGIRSLEIIEKYLAAGVQRVIIGTSAITDPKLVRNSLAQWGSDRILVGVDARDGLVAVDGWKTITDRLATDLVAEMIGWGLKTVIYTDISRDGMMLGPNVESIRALASSSPIQVIASGGISGLTDLRAIKALEPLGVTAVIAGRAIYDQAFSVSEALAVLD